MSSELFRVIQISEDMYYIGYSPKSTVFVIFRMQQA